VPAVTTLRFWKRRLFPGRIFCGKPATTFPENAYRLVTADTAIDATLRHPARIRIRRSVRREHDPEKRIPVFGKDHAQTKKMEKTMSKRSRFTRCAWCGNPFPVDDGQVQQWRVDGDRFACNEFCAEGVEQQSASPSAS
jgi:hypothetical protein